MTRPMSRRPGRGSATAALVLSITALASGCAIQPGDREDGVVGVDPSWEGDEPLLSEDDLAGGYRDDRAPGEGADLTQAGCLSAVDPLQYHPVRPRKGTLTTHHPL